MIFSQNISETKTFQMSIVRSTETHQTSFSYSEYYVIFRTFYSGMYEAIAYGTLANQFYWLIRKGFYERIIKQQFIIFFFPNNII